MGWGGASWGPKGRGWGAKIFLIMRGEAGMGQDKIMLGGGKDPILRPHSIAIPMRALLDMLSPGIDDMT